MTSNFNPVNRHIMVEKVTVEEDNFAKAYASELKSLQSYVLAKVLKVSPDCEKVSGLKEGDQVVVPANMIIEFELDGLACTMVQENYILAISE